MGTEPGVLRDEVWLKYTTKETLNSHGDHDHPVGDSTYMRIQTWALKETVKCEYTDGG